MTNQEILEKAITKAIDGGWKVGKQISYSKNMGWIQTSDGPPEPKVTENGVTARLTQLLGPNDIIYDKGFAKALWPPKPLPKEIADTFIGSHPDVRAPDWRDHLKKMVVSEDPIKYLGENI